ncbi:IPT/TIG domain-containing protein [Mucilaginibacter sp. PAMB04274]|uniref:IPT/TIG domain-containing protein n=1 Tax=Mucilaginibacter sp. PAMB04274 TaxID=3138568 RepID=UPI0031F6F0AC
MKKLLLFSFLVAVIVAACKKDKISTPRSEIIPQSNNTPTPGNPNTPALAITVTGVSPLAISAGMSVDILGSNFGSSLSEVSVSLNGVPATVKSVTNTKITVIAPVTNSGKVTVTIGSQWAEGGDFYYDKAKDLPTSAYTSGDVILNTQAQVDAFVTLNKDNPALTITGNLSITGFEITSIAGLDNILIAVTKDISINTLILRDINLRKLTSAGSITLGPNSIFAGVDLAPNGPHSAATSIDLSSLTKATNLSIVSCPQLTKLTLGKLSSLNTLYIFACPLLTEADFTSLTSAASMRLYEVGLHSLAIDRVASASDITLSIMPNLRSISFRALQQSTILRISDCPQINHIDFSTLTKITNSLNLVKLPVNDMSAFAKLQSVSELIVSNCANLKSFKGLENLTSLSLNAISTNGILPAKPVGLTITGNPVLTSLSGLDNLNVTWASITNNPSLSDLCPFKKQLILLNALPLYSYKRYIPSQIDTKPSRTVIETSIALTLTGNGQYATQTSAIAALATCP